MSLIARRARPSLFTGTLFLTVPLAAVAAWPFVVWGLIMVKEARSAWRSPETEVGVARLRLGAAARGVQRGESAGYGEDSSALADFDGDGTLDRLSVEYYHQETPFAKKSSSGMVLVMSGSTGETLLGYATPCHFYPASWCGDVDGNGTQDVIAESDIEPIVFGFVGRD
jgi:hypothetical protein